MSKETLYFAYGSNMDVEQMKNRCRTAELFCTAELKNYKLVERLHADIERSEGDSVFGVLFFIQSNDLRCLDAYEGFPNYYGRHIVEVETEHGNYHCIVYEMTSECKKSRDCEPYGSYYRQLCSDAAEYHKLPRNEYKTTELAYR